MILRTLPLLALLLAPSTALGAETEEEEPSEFDLAFPDLLLAPEAAAALLNEEALGPPAERYDQTTRTPQAASELERELEALVLGGDAERLAASDALRRYGRLALQLRRAGEVHDIHSWFLAEHVGLANPPHELGWFMTGAGQAGEMVELVGGLTADAVKDDDLRALAITLERHESEDYWLGLITASYGTVAFEPFPRRHEPGSVAILPGATLASKETYALHVSYPQAEVRSFPLQGEGAFDIEVPLPEEPGVYRVCMGRHVKRQLPESPFFFSLYVGVEPPSAFVMPDVAIHASNSTVDQLEEDFVDAINRERARFDQAPLALVGSRQASRELVAQLPERDRARWRYLNKALARDPLPELPHGVWQAAFSSGYGARDAAWMSLEHPISRRTLLDPAYTMITLGAKAFDAGQGYSILSISMEPPDDPEQARDEVFAAISQQWAGRGGEPLEAPQLQAALDAIAGRVAGGETSAKKAFKEVKKLCAKREIVGGAVSMMLYRTPAGQLPDTSAFQVPSEAYFLAVGQGSGDLGEDRGVTYTALLVVAASEAE